MEGKMQLFEQQFNVLYYGTLHRVNFKHIWTSFVKNGAFTRHAESLNSILPKEPITKTYS